MWVVEKAGERYRDGHDSKVSTLKWCTFIKIRSTKCHGGLQEQMRVSFIGDHLTVNAVGVQILALPSPILANSEEYRSGDALKSLKVIKKKPISVFQSESKTPNNWVF